MNKEITTYLQGGLGNQLFQISNALSLSLDFHGTFFLYKNIAHDIKHGTLEKYTKNLYKKITFKNCFDIDNNFSMYHEPSFSYQKINFSSNLCLFGFFQSEKYFIHNRKQILNLFSESEEENAYIEKKYGDLLKNYICTSIHVRRGDYLGLKDFHPFCSSEYYMESINYLKDTEKYIIFSDDLEWCKNNLYYLGLEKQIKNVIFIDEIDFLSLRIMSKTKNNIIANSTFSWWGAWLNNSENTVICPEQWFGEKLSHLDTKDLIPERWKKMK